MGKILAQGDLVGSITSPLENTGYGTVTGGLGMFITNILRLFFVVAGIMALFNFVIAGFKFINAGGDAKAVSAAWDKIWQSLMGLVIIVGSFAIAAIFGQLIFGRADFILNPGFYGPN